MVLRIAYHTLFCLLIGLPVFGQSSHQTSSSPPENSNTITTDTCDFIYDTISDSRYRIHKHILDKYEGKSEIGYLFDNGDTLNTFLYHQDIAVFLSNINPNETGIYKLMTNKIIFIILTHEAKQFDHHELRRKVDLDYFLEHVSSPKCWEVGIDEIIQTIKEEMPEPDTVHSEFKQQILISLALAKMNE
jgi:hypothetical protein